LADAWDPSTFDPHDPGFLREPWPSYEHFREQAPISPVKGYGTDRWVFRYDDVNTVLMDQQTFVKNAPGPPPPKVGPYAVMSSFPRGVFFEDPPRHAELRVILEPALRAAMKGAPALAGQLADARLAAVAGTGRIDLIADYALPLPADLLFTVLGIPNDPGVWAGLRAWQGAVVAAHDVTQTPAVRAAGATVTMALRTFLTGLVKRCVSDPASATGMLGTVCVSIGDDLTIDDVAASFQDLIIAGYLSTSWLIASGMVQLLDNPDQMKALRDDPALMPGAIQEMLRFDGPVQVVDRAAAVDTVLGGTPLKAGDKLGVVVGSADHDPSVFPSPERFDIRRDNTRGLGFGAGIHTCIGAPLAVRVAPVAIAKLLAVPELAVDGLAQWQSDPYLRGLVNLPVRVGGL
jgi:cytochrome P450